MRKQALPAWLSIALLAAPPALAQAAGDAVLTQAERIIREHRLLTPQQLRCSTLILRADSDAQTGRVGVHEKHGGGCGGDPSASPRRFDLEIDMRTGAARWDNNFPDMEMRPVPPRRR